MFLSSKGLSPVGVSYTVAVNMPKEVKCLSNINYKMWWVVKSPSPPVATFIGLNLILINNLQLPCVISRNFCDLSLISDDMNNKANSIITTTDLFMINQNVFKS